MSIAVTADFAGELYERTISHGPADYLRPTASGRLTALETSTSFIANVEHVCHGAAMSFLSELAALAQLESASDYKVNNPHQGWAVLSMFGPTSESDVAGFWKLQRGCDEGEAVERFLNRYPGRVELALVTAEEVGLEYMGTPQRGSYVLVVRPVNRA